MTAVVPSGTSPSISATNILIDGVLNANGAGFAGGANAINGNPGFGPGGGEAANSGTQFMHLAAAEADTATWAGTAAKP